MKSTNSLKEYYIKINNMMNNAVNLLTAINQSLTTSSSQILVNVVDSDDNNITVKIPSFLYLENRIEQLDNNFSTLFNMPKSGEAWFEQTNNIYKLKLVKSNTAPSSPEYISDNIGFNVKENNIIKDLVNPKTYIRLKLNNVPDNINQIFMKKMVFHNESDISYLRDCTSYEDYKAALYNKIIGVDYDEYDSIIDMPVKQDRFKSKFIITSLSDLEDKNPYYSGEDTTTLTYEIHVDTITYTDKDDSSIKYTLKIGDLLTLDNNYVIYKVKNVKTIYNSTNTNDSNDHVLILEEYVGHASLQSYYENSSMILSLYNDDYSDYHYVDVPLEENRFITIFLSTIYNNVRSTLSAPLLIDLNNINMVDDQGIPIKDENGNLIKYFDYYNQYCKNIGDLILGLSETAYPQISNYSNYDLKVLTESYDIKQLVNESMYNNGEFVFNVNRINGHLIDNESKEKILQLHQSKSALKNELSDIQNNIDTIYNQLVNTDFSTNVNVTYDSLKSQLDTYYTERKQKQTQLITIVDNINAIKSNVVTTADAKYRVRGVTNCVDKNDSSEESPIVTYLHSSFGQNCNIIGIDIQYKYKSINKNTSSLEEANNIVFTDWNKLQSIERERYLEFDNNSNKYNIKFVKYIGTDNIIKWNQIDIPINDGEDVILKIRYKYSIGQPFINIYSPWSDEVTVSFPAEFKENVEISSIFDDNYVDTLSSKFMNTLINEGYQEHISNKLVDNSSVFYHTAKDIYSGFNTPENNLISLQDKLQSMDNDIQVYKSLIDNSTYEKYEVLLEWDNNILKLSNSTQNNVTINELINSTNDSFIKKKMNIIIKNIGAVPIKMYSIFPGYTETPLINTDYIYYNSKIGNYERVPLLLENKDSQSESIIPQTLGQWIYFRQNNIYTNENYYYVGEEQIVSDMNAYAAYLNSSTIEKNKVFTYNPITNYLGKDNNQLLLPYRKRVYSSDGVSSSVQNLGKYGVITKSNDIINVTIPSTDNQYSLTYSKQADFVYSNWDSTTSFSNYILKYEHFINRNKQTGSKYLTKNDSLATFIKNNPDNLSINSFHGAVLIPELLGRTQILCDNDNINNQYMLLDVGKTLSIPILFEYYLKAHNDDDLYSNNSTQITKTISFDIRPSLMHNAENYILSVTAKYDFSQTNSSINSGSLLDSDQELQQNNI